MKQSHRRQVPLVAFFFVEGGKGVVENSGRLNGAVVKRYEGEEWVSVVYDLYLGSRRELMVS